MDRKGSVTAGPLGPMSECDNHPSEERGGMTVESLCRQVADTRERTQSVIWRVRSPLSRPQTENRLLVCPFPFSSFNDVHRVQSLSVLSSRPWSDTESVFLVECTCPQVRGWSKEGTPSGGTFVTLSVSGAGRGRSKTVRAPSETLGYVYRRL